MKTMLKIILLIATACQLAMGEDIFDDNNVLLWMVNDSPTAITDFDGSQYSISELVGRGEASGMTANAARVLATAGDSQVQLQVKTTDMDTWSSMVALPDGDGEYNAGPAWANLSGLDLNGNPDLSFIVELGYFNGNDWFTLAASKSTLASQLSDFIRPAQLAQYGQLEWIPSYQVPEPNSWVLMLLGFCMLFSRRMNAKQCLEKQKV